MVAMLVAMCALPLGLITGTPHRYAAQHSGVRMNIFGDMFDDGLLKEQTPYPKPLLPKLVKKRAASYVLQEKLLSFSGEDFSVRDTEGNTVIQIEGANLNLGGMVIDKLGFKDEEGAKFMSVERRILAATTCCKRRRARTPDDM